MTISAITYNDDGYAIPLVSGHTYIWTSWGYGYDENYNSVAISVSDYWVFYRELDSCLCRNDREEVRMPSKYKNTRLLRHYVPRNDR